MKMIKQFFTTILFSSLLCLNGFSNNAHFIHDWNRLLIDLMVKDGFSPVLATRGFVYPNIAAYESLAFFDNKMISLKGKLNSFIPPEITMSKNDLLPEAVMVHAMYIVSKEVMYREQECEALYQKHIKELSEKHELIKVLNSKLLGEMIGNYVISWMKQDGYNETKAKPNYIFQKGEFYWQPTPPEFRNALEPNWKSLRPFVIENAAAYSEPLKVTPDSSKQSEFYKLQMEVYNISKKLTPEQKLIAEFWDDNPDLNDQYKGHVGIPRRHINPASHWISIAKQVCIKNELSLVHSVKVYTLLSIAEADAKIAVWHDKYTQHIIRPVTYIQRYIDSKWMPHLVTPPFPEHTSGHSACSMACAEVLSCLVGAHISFTDSTMVKYLGLPVRTFSSFRNAALEVSESRVLGGIHIRTAVDDGMIQGRKIGALVCRLLNE
jgi:hypothetical protein